MAPSMACGAARECTHSFSSVNNTGEVLGEEFGRLPYHGKPFVSSPPEIGEDDGDLQHVITGGTSPPALPAAKKKKRSLPGTPGACMHGGI
jgi:hypothetical protein